MMDHGDVFFFAVHLVMQFIPSMRLLLSFDVYCYRWGPGSANVLGLRSRMLEVMVDLSCRLSI